MSALTEIRLVERWIYGRLTSDDELATLMGGTVRASQDPADLNEAFPFVVFSAQSQTPIGTQNAVRVMTQHRYMIKVVERGSSKVRIDPIAARIDELFHLPESNVVGATAEGEIMSSVLFDLVNYPEQDEGVTYLHLGGVYEITSRVTA